jgi:protein ImuB
VTFLKPGEVRDGDVRPSISSLSERPIRLFDTPHPVEMMPGRNLSFRWRRLVYTAIHKEGPERIAPEWWHEEADAATRDYFRVEDEDGHRYWLFREKPAPSGEGDPRWFMQGVFA